MDPKVIATELPKVLTHIVGFVIAVLILRRYAWGPILKLLEERRAKIQGEFDRIDETRRQVESLQAQYEAQLREIEGLRRARIQEGVQEGRRVSNEIQEKARQEKVAQMERTRQDIALEWDKAHLELRDDMVRMVVQATERLLKERLDEARHRKLIEEYLAELEAAGGRSGR